MGPLEKIVQAVQPGPSAILRAQAYGPAATADFLHDVVALANADVDSRRVIVTGIAADETREYRGISDEDCRGNQVCAKLVAEHVEPMVKLRYEAIVLDDKRFGIFIIDPCFDQPYMLSSDHGETLQRGDAWMQVNGSAVRLGRSELERMFEMQFRHVQSAEAVHVGIGSDADADAWKFACADMEQLPSTLAEKKIRQLIQMVDSAKDTGASSRIVRLGHARLFGNDCPYEKKSVPELFMDLKKVHETHADEDRHFLFSEHGAGLQLSIRNDGNNALEDVELTLSLPKHEALFVAEQPPAVAPRGNDMLLDDNPLDERPPAANDDNYPDVRIGEQAVRVSASVGRIDAGQTVSAFGAPLSIAVGAALAGRKVGIHYAVKAKNLRRTAKGKLRLLPQAS